MKHYTLYVMMEVYGGLTEALDCGWVRLPDIPQDEPKQTEK
ncbi:hypothetical protein [Avibacterium avium]